MVKIKELFIGCCLLFCITSFAQKNRTVTIIHDNAQTNMTTKVYNLKNSLANDIYPFIDAAVRRNNPNSRCDRISFSDNSKQMLVVTMDPMMIPYVDDLVKKLDHKAPHDEDGSTVKNAGVYDYIYRPIHRSTDAMYAVINSDIWADNETAIFRDPVSNLISWKGATTARGLASWIKTLDRPVPQVKLTMKIYTINESDLKQTGFDYISWKNGPGRNFLGFGFDYVDSNVNVESQWNNKKYASDGGHSFSGISFSPQIDLSFVRMLGLKGVAKVKSAGSVVVKNDYGADAIAHSFDDAKYRISYKPNYSSIVKDTNDTTTVTDASNIDYELYFSQQVVTYPSTTGNVKFHSPGGFSAIFNLTINSEVGKAEGSTVGGDPIIDSQTFKSSFRMVCEVEKLLASFTKEQEIEQYSGIPFLSELPGCKHIFGMTTKSISRVHMYVTLLAEPVSPDLSLSDEDMKVVRKASDIKKIDKTVRGESE